MWKTIKNSINHQTKINLGGISSILRSYNIQELGRVLFLLTLKVDKLITVVGRIMALRMRMS